LTLSLGKGKQSASYKRYIGANKELCKDNKVLEKTITEFKTDVQNLLVGKQSDSELLKNFRKDIYELQFQRTTAEDEVKKLNYQLEKRNKYIAHLQNIIVTRASEAINADNSCNGPYLPLPAVHEIVTEGLVEYFTEVEQLHETPQKEKEKEKSRDIQAKLNLRQPTQ
jgi:hypothetical protein